MNLTVALWVLLATMMIPASACDARQAAGVKGQTLVGGRQEAAPGKGHALLGAWQEVDKGWRKIEFFREGTVSIVKGLTSQVGDYRWLDDTRIRVDWKAEPGRAGILTVSVSGDELLLTDLQGTVERYQRSRPSDTAILRHYFEVRKAVILRGDVEAFWRGVKKRSLQELGPVPDFAAMLKKDPEWTKRELVELGLDKKELSKITAEDLLLAEIRREFALIEDLSLHEVKEAGEQAELTVHEKYRKLYRGRMWQEKLLKLVREDGVWHEDAGQAIDSVKIGRCQRLIDTLTESARSYAQASFSLYPPTGNASLVKALKTKGPNEIPHFEFAAGMLNSKGEILDPWGRPIIYISTREGEIPKDWGVRSIGKCDIYSFGPDGKDDRGEGDDQNNWR